MPPKIVRFLGSIRLAVPLLIAIAVVLIGATFYESEVGSLTVQTQIYKSPWFGAIMFLLAVNLGISTLSRWPWKGPRKVGFALTHWGLVVIIAGSAAVIHLSTEGMLLVRTDAGPGQQIRVQGDLLEVVAPDQSRQQTDIFIKPDGTVHPKQFAGLQLLGYSDRTMKTVQFTDDGTVDNVAVHLQLHSDRMGQTLERWLAVAPAGYSQMDVGPAHLEIMQAVDAAEQRQLLSPPAPPQSQLGQLQVDDRTFEVADILGRSQSLPAGIALEVVQVWPDFRLDKQGLPSSASQEFRNPALQVNLARGEQQAQWFVFGKVGFEPVRSGDAIDLAIAYDAPSLRPTDYFRVVVTPDQQLFYAAASSTGFETGELLPGQAVRPGWADFQISLTEQLTHAQVQRQIVPMMPVAQGTLANEGSPALHVATADGQDFWLSWGEPTSLNTADGNYFAAFSPKMLMLPFYVKLDDFIVERNEGSESVAMWTSQVTLFDPQTDTATQRRVWMNHPTWFRGWKLAQASWNPGDLAQSTLQLKREPWWVTALTWMGSMLIVLGIGVMFYGPAIVKRWRRWTKTTTSESMPETALPETEPATTIPILAMFGKSV